jgi:hypothetical protein
MAARISRVRGIWLAGLVALSLLTFGIVPRTSAAGAGRPTSVPVVQSGGHLDQVVLTRTQSSHVASLKSPVSYGDLAVGSIMFGLGAWLLVAARSRRRVSSSLIRGPRLSRAPPVTA